jgi:ssDNA-binding Zn-finger/Zn-ribbon topoisomerase 1
MKAVTRKNALGYWVGCIQYEDGKVSEISNAKHDERIALEIAQRVIESGAIAKRQGWGEYKRQRGNT